MLAAVAVLGLAGLTTLTAPPAQAVTPGTSAAYITDAGDNAVSVIDTATGAVTATIPVGFGPQAAAATPDGSRVYVANTGSNTVSVIDTSTQTVTATVTAAASPTAVAVTPDGGRVYVADLGAAALTVIDAATDTVTATIPVAQGPDALAVSPDGSQVYAASSSGTVSVVDTGTGTVTGVVHAGSFPVSLALAPDGARLYVADPAASAVEVIDTASATVAATIPTDAAPYALAAAPDGASIYLVNTHANSVAVLDTATGTVTATIAVGAQPQGLALTPDGGSVYVTDTGDSAVSVIDTATGTVTGTTAVGRFPTGIAMAATPRPAPVVTSVSPASGPPSGGTTVTLAGSHLADAGDITFGPGHSATDVHCTDTDCTAVAPAASAGTVDVRVTTAAGTSDAVPADHYTYAAADLGVAVAARPAPGLLGGRIDYTVTVTDHGPSAATSATVTVPLSAPVRAESDDCATTRGVVTCAVGPLASGAAVNLRFSVPVGLLTLNLPFTVTANRTASAPVDTAAANDHATRTCTVVTSLLINCR